MAHSGSLCSPQRDEIMIVIVIKKSLRELTEVLDLIIALAQARLASGLFSIVNPTVIHGQPTVICLCVNLHKAAIPEDLVI